MKVSCDDGPASHVGRDPSGAAGDRRPNRDPQSGSTSEFQEQFRDDSPLQLIAGALVDRKLIADLDVRLNFANRLETDIRTGDAEERILAIPGEGGLAIQFEDR